VVAEDQEFQRREAMAMQGQIVEHLEGMTAAQVKRALRGRTDAFKLLLEVGGIHNSKVQHEHSGGIELKLVAVPRPPPVDNTPNERPGPRPQLDEAIVDAEVIDDD
jgi:hypothetical protein